MDTKEFGSTKRASRSPVRVAAVVLSGIVGSVVMATAPDSNAGVCICGYQPYWVCNAGVQYQHSFCRDQNNQSCGETEVPTGLSC